jgi:predicted nucleotide-binding protein
MKFFSWSELNGELLQRLFDSNAIYRQHMSYSGIIASGSADLVIDRELFHKAVEDEIRRLESVTNRLELFPEPTASDATEEKPSSPTIPAKKSFIVHGHDTSASESVARFLERLGIEPVILHEMASGGSTVIEKLERYSDVKFAVVLLTPDDVGATADQKNSLKPRARQNVILEFGYFVGKLGRSNVCALLKGDVEIPSDMMGIIYVPMDHGRGWRLSLATELRDAGFKIDMNRL